MENKRNFFPTILDGLMEGWMDGWVDLQRDDKFTFPPALTIESHQKWSSENAFHVGGRPVSGAAPLPADGAV